MLIDTSRVAHVPSWSWANAGVDVTGIDIDEGALALAAERAREQGLDHIDFAHSDIGTYRTDVSYDAVIGRHILIHSKDPLAVLRDCSALLHERGLAVFHEYDFSVVHHGWPPTPLRDRAIDVFDRFFAGVTCANIGSRLPTLTMFLF